MLQWGIGGDDITLPTAYTTSYKGFTCWNDTWSASGLNLTHLSLWNRTLTSFTQDAGGSALKAWLTIGY